MKIMHIYHSSILIETEDMQIFFDVFTDIEEIIDNTKKIFFFVSHGHGDHFSPKILDYKDNNTYYVVSDDINIDADMKILKVRPDEFHIFENLKINTYESTDREFPL